jgi:hypothetical protein
MMYIFNYSNSENTVDSNSMDNLEALAMCSLSAYNAFGNFVGSP